MFIAPILFVISQSAVPAEVRPEPVPCEKSGRDLVAGSRLWCPGEVKALLPRHVLTTAPIDQIGKGWALLKCDIGDDGTTTACSLVDESEPGSRFGIWATRAQLRAIVQETDGNSPVPGDSYYAHARWQLN